MKSVLSNIARGRKIMCLLGAILGVFLFSLSLFAQASGRILGTVTDQSGAVISGATVSVIDTQRGLARTLTTDQAGEYNAPNLIPGSYTIRVEAKGFQTLNRQNVELEVGKEVRVDLTPRPGEQTQSVTITEAIPLIDTASATLGGTLNNAEINDLPLNGRNFQSLLGLRPGVMLQPGGSPWTQSTNNVRPDETSWTVDGILNANAFDARPVAGSSSAITDGATILPIDAIQEFNLMENPKAEFGGKPGAMVLVGIRSGTNQLHGSAYAFGRNGDWDARNVFSPTLALPLDLEQYGGAMGGPIKKDKLFFFGNYERMHSALGNALGTAVPYTGPGSPAGSDPRHSMVDAISALQAKGIPVSPLSLKLLGCTVGASIACTGGYIQNDPASTTTYVSSFPNVNDTYNGIGKIDYRINDKHMVNGMLYRAIYQGAGEDFPQVNSAWTNVFPGPVWTGSGNWIWTATSSLVNEFRFGYNRSHFGLIPADSSRKADGKDYPINTGITSYGGFPSVVVSGFGQTRLGSRGGRPLESNGNPYTNFQDNVSYLKGRHSFKVGFDFANISANSDPHDTRGRINFKGNQAFKNSTTLEDFFAGLPSDGSQLIGNPNVTAVIHDYGAFFQDDWRIVPKIMLNLGIRYEYRSPFKADHNALGNFDPNLGLVQQGQASVGDTLWKPDRKNWSPRVGIAWDLTGKGTTVIRAGGGIYYSMFSLAPFTGNPGIANTQGTSIATVPTGACKTSVPIGGTCPATFGGTIAIGTAQIPGSKLNWDGVVFPQGALLACTAARPCSIGSVDPHLKTPYVGAWNFGVQHAFGSNLSLDVSYVGTHGDNLIGSVDLNAPTDLATGALPYATKFPYLQFINHIQNHARSNYNSLQSTLTKRLSRGLSFTAGYTYGHGLDNGSLNRFGSQPQDQTRPQLEYAASDFDIRHRATFTASYEIPGTRRFGQLLSGWKLNTIVTLAGSQPWIVVDGADNFSGSNENTDRWNFFGNPSDFKATSPQSFPYCTGFGTTDGVTCTSTSGISGLVSNYPSSLGAKCVAMAPDQDTLATAGCFVSKNGKSVMVPNAAGHYGTMGRNIFRDTGFKNVDFSVFKTFRFRERINAQFRAEFFNFFNHPLYGNPYGSVAGSAGGNDPSSGTTFGCGCTTPDNGSGNPIVGSGDSRTVQLGFKLTF